MIFASKRQNMHRIILPAAVGVLCLLSGGVQSQADVLKGGVEEEGTLRLQRPDNTQNGSASQEPLRIQRPMMAPPIAAPPMRGLVDTSAFSSPLKGNANDNDAKLGLLKPAEFGTIPNSKFDLGTERNSRELTLAWEAWHHQLSGEIYHRWSQVATLPGAATLRITVSKARFLTPVIMRSSGNPEFDRVLIQTVLSLNGDPGLTFPAKSERQTVTFEADYVAATDIQPGYSWVKNDYEKVRQDY
jgi:hypothetical protein